MGDCILGWRVSNFLCDDNGKFVKVRRCCSLLFICRFFDTPWFLARVISFHVSLILFVSTIIGKGTKYYKSIVYYVCYDFFKGVSFEVYIILKYGLFYTNSGLV